MKSLDKFQYDSSPHTNEEVEELEEISLVGMRRAAGKAIGNVLQAGKNLIKKAPDPTPTLSTAQRMSNALDKPEVKDAIKNKRGLPQNNKVDNVIKNQTKKVERVQKRAQNKIDTAKENRVKEFATTRNLLNLKKDPSSKGFQRAQRNITSKPTTGKGGLDNAGSNKPSLSTRIKRLGYKDPSKARDLVQGGLSSKLVRNVGSVAKAVGQEITKTPDNKIAYNQKGDGYQGAFQGLGSNVKGVGKNVLKAPTFSSTKIDKKTGEVTKGAQVGTVGDKLGLSSLANRNIDKSSNLSKQKVTGVKDDEADRKKITGGEPQFTKALQDRLGGMSSDDLDKNIEAGRYSKGNRPVTQNNTKPKEKQLSLIPGLTDTNVKSTTTDDEGVFRRSAKRKPMTSQESPTGAIDKDGNPISRGSKDQAYITYNKNKKKKPKITGRDDDGYPTGKDATHWLDAQKQHSSKTPKLFEQFLFEIDTRSTKKKKKDGRGMHPHDEIKPMSGTNTITINPEDETSKYKRGY